MTIDELINDVQMYITMSGAMPKQLPDLEIRRIIDSEGKPFFWERDTNSLMKEYLYVPSKSFGLDKQTHYRSVELPCNIQYVTWLYRMDKSSLFELGVAAPNLSVNMATSTSQYLSSYTTTIGELGVYKVIIDGFADQLNQLTKYTLKHDFNSISKKLNILTSMGSAYEDKTSSVVAEVYAHIPDEDMFELPDFRDYIKAKALIQYGRMITRFNFKLPGDITMDGSSMITEGKEMLDEVKARIKGKNNSGGWFWMIKK